MQNKKTAFIYNKYLDTLGGAEVVACNMAKHLHDNGYLVKIIAGKEVDKEIIKKKLGVDLTGIEILEIWNDEIKLERIVKGSDLFINTTFIDYSRGYAKKNIYYTLFPTQANNNWRQYLFNEIINPIVIKKIKPIEFIKKTESLSVGNNLGYLIKKEIKIAYYNFLPKEKYCLKFIVYLKPYSKTLIESLNVEIENADILNRKVKFNHIHNTCSFEYTIMVKTSSVVLILKNTKNKYTIGDLFLIAPAILPASNISKHIKKIENMFIQRARAGIFLNIKERLKTYGLILADSGFTQIWIEKYWNRQSQILYPPVKIIDFHKIKKEKKKNYILSLGRFFTLGHGKKQEILIEAFKKFYDKQKDKSWQLHLIGSITYDGGTQKYVSLLKEKAKNYPIHFHFNASRKDVEKYLLQSKLYWHATGYGENKNKFPIKFEHFGISVIEAISAGCLPVLYNGGGLPEIIKKLDLDKNIHIFNSIEELVKNSKRIITKYKKFEIIEISKKTKTFSLNEFNQQLKRFIK